MVSEIYGGIGAFKAMFDMAKGLKDISDAAIRNRAVIELQEEILGAQVSQSALLERVSFLEKEITRFETWDAEKQRYELKKVVTGAFVYTLKPEVEPPEEPHWLCTTCYQNNKKSILQILVISAYHPGHGGQVWICASCPTKINVPYGQEPGKPA